MSHTIRINKEDLPKRRSFIQMDANGRRGGTMRDKRDRRSKDARKSKAWMNEE